MSRRRWIYIGLAAPVASLAQTTPLETVEVVGQTPLGGGVAAEQLPSTAQIVTADEIRAQRALGLADFMRRTLSSVFVNEAQGNPLQPDIQYRGFVGSPLLGLPQGIAVYQDGVRVNEPFGDTVNWALIPDSAIDTVYLMPGSNPLFGLNALGGAISIQTKDGFSHAGTRAEISAGSFGRRKLQAETGGSIDDRLGYFLTGSYIEEDGWRDFSPTEATQLFANLGWDRDRTRLDANLTYVDTQLIGNGPAPIELLELDRAAIFTRPDITENELALWNFIVDHDLSDRLKLTGNLYLRDSDVSTLNGDDSDFEECQDTPGFICEVEDGEEEVLVGVDGNTILADESLQGATINRSKTRQQGIGFGLQANLATQVRGASNLLLVGMSYDESDIDYDATTELGALDATRFTVPGGVFVGESFTQMTATTENTGLYFSNSLTIASIVLTISGRYNLSKVRLQDALGTALNGDHEFQRFNPAAGLTYMLARDLTFYAGLSESNRAPSPVELTCADEDDPCRLPNAFLADPPLRQVVAQTFEAGFRGTSPWASWQAGLFRTDNEDDILFISAGALTNQGFFDNVGKTRRDGIELSIQGETGERLHWFANYTYLDATFRQALAAPSANNPAAVGGEIFVEPGDRLPLIPSRMLKAGLTFTPSDQLTLGGEILATSGHYFRGDEGNAFRQVDGYALLNLRGEYRFNDAARVFVNIDNLLDADYETFGLFGAAGEVLGDSFQDARFLSPGAPRAAWVGISLEF